MAAVTAAQTAAHVVADVGRRSSLYYLHSVQL
jgi:hypothetical protein